MELINIPAAENIALLHFQNTIVDYEIRMTPATKENMTYYKVISWISIFQVIEKVWKRSVISVKFSKMKSLTFFIYCDQLTCIM